MNTNIKSLAILFIAVTLALTPAYSSLNVNKDITDETELSEDLEDEQNELILETAQLSLEEESELKLQKEQEEKFELEMQEEHNKKLNGYLENKRVEDIKKEEEIKEAQELAVANRGGFRTSKEMDFKATAYDLSYNSCQKEPGHAYYGVTASGFNLSGLSREEAMSVAVDPKIIPLGTKLLITFPEEYSHFNGVYTARDTGGAIKGHKMDIFMGDFSMYDTHQSVWDFGIKYVTVEILE